MYLYKFLHKLYKQLPQKIMLQLGTLKSNLCIPLLCFHVVTFCLDIISITFVDGKFAETLKTQNYK